MKNLLPPLWIKFPHISAFSIGWRMGYGEDYKVKFNDWFEVLSEDKRREYMRLFPEPATWRGYWNDTTGEDESALIANGEDFLINIWEREPRYDLKWLKKRYGAGKADKILLFWGHQKEAQIGASCLSQWYPSVFTESERYVCAEQYMMAKKAECFGDAEILEKILATKDPKKMKDLGRRVRDFDADFWDEIKFGASLNANYLKFSQNEDLREFLLSTKNKILVEASPHDKIWGIGMSANEQNAQNPVKWRGQNLLGFALMRVRDEIARVYENVHLCDASELTQR